MSGFWGFAESNPGTAFLMVGLALYAATRPFAYAARSYRRHLRHLDIQRHGWPTAPIDSDGDVVYPENSHHAE